MKKVILYFVCMSLSLPAFAGKKKREPSSYKLESGTFSSLFLTKDEIASLSSEDRTIYLLSIVSLAQIIETSQSKFMGKTNEMVAASLEPQQAPSKLQAWIQALEGKAYAGPIVLLFRAAAAVAPKVANMFSKVGTYSSGRVATAAAAKAASPIIKGIMQASKKGLVEAAKKTESARVAYGKHVASKNFDKTKAEELKKAWAVAQKNQTALQREVMKKATTKADKEALGKAIADVTKEAGQRKVFTMGQITALSLGYAAYEALDAFGFSPEALLQAAEATDIAKVGVGVATVVETAATIAGATPASESPKEEGGVCLFGGYPSVWKNFNGEILCTRPKESSTETCKDAQFQCPTYGLVANSESIESDLCIPKDPLSNITVRCSKKLVDAINQTKAEAEADHFMQMHDKLKAAVQKLESTEHMKNDKGETKSIQQYCAGAQQTQGEECKAVFSVISTMKSTEAVSMIATRQAEGIDSQAAPADASK